MQFKKGPETSDYRYFVKHKLESNFRWKKKQWKKTRLKTNFYLHILIHTEVIFSEKINIIYLLSYLGRSIKVTMWERQLHIHLSSFMDMVNMTKKWQNQD